MYHVHVIGYRSSYHSKHRLNSVGSKIRTFPSCLKPTSRIFTRECKTETPAPIGCECTGKVGDWDGAGHSDQCRRSIYNICVYMFIYVPIYVILYIYIYYMYSGKKDGFFEILYQRLFSLKVYLHVC